MVIERLHARNDTSKPAYTTSPKDVLDARAARCLDCGRRHESRGHAAVTPLKIVITSAGLALTRALRGDVRRRVLLALSRFGREIRVVTAHLTESANPLGGVDPRCRLDVHLGSGARLCAEAMGDRIETAASRSAAHLALLVGAALDVQAGRPKTPGSVR